MRCRSSSRVEPTQSSDIVTCTANGGEVSVSGVEHHGPDPPNPPDPPNAWSLGTAQCVGERSSLRAESCTVEVVFEPRSCTRRVSRTSLDAAIGLSHETARCSPTVSASMLRRLGRWHRTPQPQHAARLLGVTQPWSMCVGSGDRLTGAIGSGPSPLRTPAHIQQVDPLAEVADGPSHDAVVSADGRFVAYESEATNLVPNQGLTDPEGDDIDVFLHDRDVSGDGVFDEVGDTATRVLSTGDGLDGLRRQPVDLRQRPAGRLRGHQQRQRCCDHDLRCDDRTAHRGQPQRVPAIDLDLDGDSRRHRHVGPVACRPVDLGRRSSCRLRGHFGGPRQRQLGHRRPRPRSRTERVAAGRRSTRRDRSHRHGRALPDPAISGNGRFVAFSAFDGTNLQVFVVDRDLDENGSYVFDPAEADEWLEVVSTDPAGVPGDDSSMQPAITTDGRYVAFATDSTIDGPVPARATATTRAPRSSCATGWHHPARRSSRSPWRSPCQHPSTATAETPQ